MIDWRCSSPVNNVSYFPDIPASAGNIEPLEQSIQRSLYVYPIPGPISCNATVLGVQYCYQQAGTEENTIFTLLILQMDSKFSTNVRVLKNIPIPAPKGICASQACCETFTFDESKYFLLPTQGFAIGLETQNFANLWGFHNTQVQYYACRYLVQSAGLNLTVGSTISIQSTLSSENTLRIVRLIVGK